VNVFAGADVTWAAIGDSYFVEAQNNRQVIGSNPTLTKVY